MSMKTAAGRSSVEWFAEAGRCFVAGHQGCPSCGGRHCVFRSDWGGREEYYCSACDFSACHDRVSGAYVAVAGGGGALAPVLPSVEADDAVLLPAHG